MSYKIFILTICACFLLSACRKSPPREDDKAGKPIIVFVSIPPQAFFVERIGGELVQVKVMIPPGSSPHTYELTPRQITTLGNCQVYFRIGLAFEKPLAEKISQELPKLRVVDARSGIALRWFSDEPHHIEGEEGADPHIWLDPIAVKIQARTICDALSSLNPEHKEIFAHNLSDFEAELDRLHQQISRLLAPYKGREVWVYHPAFGYFTDRYGLKQVAIESEGKEPGARNLVELIQKAKSAHIHTIFTQIEHSSKSAQAIAGEIGAQVVPLNPLAKEYITNLKEVAEKIAASFEE